MKSSTAFKSLLIFAWLLFLFTPQIVHPTTFYVDQNHSSASNTNPGNIQLPWLTIQHAATTITAGDTVFIRAGTYNEHVFIEKSGNAFNYIVFAAYPGETPIIDGTGVTESQNGIIIESSFIKLLGLEISNWNDNGIWVQNSSFFEISDCIVHDVFYGIGLANGTHDFIINRTTVYNFNLYGFDVSPSGGSPCYNGTFNDCLSHTGRDLEQNVDGFALGHGEQVNFTFNRCTVYNVYDGFDISSRNVQLNGCLAYNCYNGCYKLWQDKIKLENCIGYNGQVSIVELDWDEEPGVVSLVNCTFFNSQSFTIWIENMADTLIMTNCIVAGGDNIGLAFEQLNASNYKGDYNLFHNDNAGRAIAVGYTDEFSLGQTESGNWTTYSGQDAHSIVEYSDNDIFVAPAQYDLQLSATSNAVDNGTSIGAPIVDFDNNPRPSGNGYDIGAYEFQTSTGIIENKGDVGIPANMFFFTNYPNPFNPYTTIQYKVPNKAHVDLSIYNTLGQIISTLVQEVQNAGPKLIVWNGTDKSGKIVDSGLYYSTLKVGNNRTTRKMLLLR